MPRFVLDSSVDAYLRAQTTLSTAEWEQLTKLFSATESCGVNVSANWFDGQEFGEWEALPSRETTSLRQEKEVG